MEIMLVIFGPGAIAFLILAASPPNMSYLILLVIALLLTGIMAAAPLPPPSAPDNWYRGIGRAGGLIGLAASMATIPAQAARRFVPLGIWAYLAALAVTAFIGVNLSFILG